VIEPSAAVGVAVALGARLRDDEKRVGVVLCGGNVDLDALPWLKR
jgi:threonine dehydratase